MPFLQYHQYVRLQLYDLLTYWIITLMRMPA